MIFVCLSLWLFPNNLYAFISWGADQKVQKHESYFYQSCQKFNQLNLGQEVTNDCVEQSHSIMVEQKLRPLLELDERISRKLKETELLTQVASFVEQKISQNLQSIDVIRNCLKANISQKPLSVNCESTLSQVKRSSIQGLPLMREHMAFMNGPEPITGPRQADEPKIGFRQKYYQRSLSHTHSKTKIPPLQQEERAGLDEYVAKMTDATVQSWLKEKSKNSRCVKLNDQNQYHFQGATCDRVMQVHLSHHLNFKFKQAQEQHKKNYQNLIQLAPHLAYIDQYKLSDDKLLDAHLLKAFDQMHSDINRDRLRIRTDDADTRKSLFRYPSLVNAFFDQQNPLDENSCSVAQDLHSKYGPGGWRELAFDIGVGVAAVVGGITCAFTAGIGCAIGVAVLSEGYYLGSTNMRLWESERLLQTQLIDHQDYEKSLSERNTAILFAPLSLVGFHSAQGVNRGLSSAATISQSRLLRRDLDLLKNEYVSFQATTPVQNKHWIDMAKNGKAKLYFDMENAALKRLNDTLGDKNFVTAATNLHKKIFLENLEILKAKFPKVQLSVYSDFKSLRVSVLDDVPPHFEAEFAKIFQQTNEEFSRQLKSLNGLSLGNEQPAQWFNAGFGKTADQAGLASRQARQATRLSSGEQKIVDFKKVRARLEDDLSGLEKMRTSIFRSLGDQDKSKLFQQGENSVFKLEVFELMRKHLQSTDAEIAQAFKKNFNLNFNVDQAMEMRKYISQLDQFSPGLWQETRVVANLDQAAKGGFSVDFKGLGAKNMQQLAIDLKNNPDNIEGALSAVRSGEQEVTKRLDAEKFNYQNLVKNSLDKYAVQATNQCSGDDCVSVLNKTLSAEAQREIVASFSRTAQPSDYRLSFIPHGVRAEHRTNLSVHGELIEKTLRKKTTGFGEDLISPEILKKVNFAVIMPTELGRGSVRVMIGTSPDISLTLVQKRQIEKRLKESLAEVNNELSGQLGVKIQYQSADLDIVSGALP